jgi:nucleotide-binding universal stress UspA family protein
MQADACPPVVASIQSRDRFDLQEISMELLSKCLLLPVDDTEESTKPIGFLRRLYPDKDHVNLIISHFLPALAPVYQQKPDSEAMVRKKRELIKLREENARAILGAARKALIEAGFQDEAIQEHLEEKELSVAHHSCRLADIRKVDAVVVQKRVTSDLEGFLKDDPTPALLHHCLVSPVWITEGDIDPSHAAVCISNENVSLRAADHAAFMLAETRTRISVLHVTRSVSHTISSSAFNSTGDLERWLSSPSGRLMRPFLAETCGSLKKAGIEDGRIEIAIVPNTGNVATDILSYCGEHGAGIVVLGHSSPGGTWGFLKSSITKKVLGSFKDMAVWVNQ